MKSFFENITLTLLDDIKKLFIISVILSLISLIATVNIQYSFTILILIYTFYLGKRWFLLFFIVFIYLVFTRELNPLLRDAINILQLVFLIILFLKEYGLKLKNFPMIPKEFIYLVLLILSWMLLSSLLSINPLKGLTLTFQQAIFFIICYLLFSLLKKKEDIYIYMTSIVFVLIVIISLMFNQIIEKGLVNFFYEEVLSKTFTLIYSMANYEGLFLAVSIPYLFFFIFKYKNKRNYQIFFIILTFFSVFTLLLTNSRASILSLAASISYLFFYYNKRKFIIVLLFFTVIFSIFYFISDDFSGFIDLFFRFERISNRDELWYTALEISKINILNGIGPGLFLDHFYSYAPYSLLEGLNLFGDHGSPTPHNFFLYFLTDMGLIGLIISFYFFYIFFIFALNVRKKINEIDKELSFLTTIIISIGIGLFFRAFFEVTGIITYGYISRDLPFWLSIVLLLFINKIYLDYSSKNDIVVN